MLKTLSLVLNVTTLDIVGIIKIYNGPCFAMNTRTAAWQLSQPKNKTEKPTTKKKYTKCGARETPVALLRRPKRTEANPNICTKKAQKKNNRNSVKDTFFDKIEGRQRINDERAI